jgi:hypothetical protein
MVARWGRPRERPDQSGPLVFSSAGDLAVDRSGNVYVLLFGQPPVQLLGPDGAFLAGWDPATVYTVPLSQFSGSASITIDRAGNVYTEPGDAIWKLACPSRT